MRTFEDLLPDLIGGHRLTGLPPEIGVFQLRKATIELCERSHVWRETLVLDAQADVADYPLDLPSGSRLVAVRAVKVGGCCLTPDSNGLCTGCSCKGHSFAVVGDKIVIPKPNEDTLGYATIEVAVKPTQDSCNLPEHLYEDWSDTIVAGAAGRCLAMPKSDWTSGPLAALQMKMFNIGVTRAKNRGLLRKTTGPIMMIGSRF